MLFDKRIIMLSMASIVILFYVLPLETIASTVLGQPSPPRGPPPKDTPGQGPPNYGNVAFCPPGQAQKPGPPPPGLQDRCT
jgi:hypothetical protein